MEIIIKKTDNGNVLSVDNDNGILAINIKDNDIGMSVCLNNKDIDDLKKAINALS